MIDHVTKITWTQPDGKIGYCYHVYYARANRFPLHKTFNFKQNLPNTVLMYVLDADECKTEYTERNTKIERYKKHIS